MNYTYFYIYILHTHRLQHILHCEIPVKTEEIKIYNNHKTRHFPHYKTFFSLTYMKLYGQTVVCMCDWALLLLIYLLFNIVFHFENDEEEEVVCAGIARHKIDVWWMNAWMEEAETYYLKNMFSSICRARELTYLLIFIVCT